MTLRTLRIIRKTWFIFLFPVLITNCARWNSKLWSNVGWLHINQAKDFPSKSATHYFAQAMQFNGADYDTYRDAGLAYAMVQDEEKALDIWSQGNVEPRWLDQFGKKMWARGQPNAAFILFRGAIKSDPNVPTEATFSAGKLCQASLSNLTSLAIDNQRYCEVYFSKKNNNLLLDGQFEYDTQLGWLGTGIFTVRSHGSLARDSTAGFPSPSLIITGLEPGQHGGVYQRISLLPGITVRFSGYFRTENITDLSARLLYVEWFQENETHGAATETIKSDMDWQYLERTFTLPDKAEQGVQFYPALVDGRGTVWIDDVRVEILSD